MQSELVDQQLEVNKKDRGRVVTTKFLNLADALHRSIYRLHLPFS